MASKRKKVSLRSEPQPDAEVLRQIEAIEEHGNVVDRDADGKPVMEENDQGDLVPVEDRSACDLDGLSLEEYGAWLVTVFPGHVHGYSPSKDPDGPTPPRPRVPNLLVEGAGEPPPVRPDCLEYVRCLQRRASLGMALHHPRDRFMMRRDNE